MKQRFGRWSGGQQWDRSHPECSRNKEAGWGSQAPLRELGILPSEPSVIWPGSPGSRVHFSDAHRGDPTKSMLPKELSVVGAEFSRSVTHVGSRAPALGPRIGGF